LSFIYIIGGKNEVNTVLEEGCVFLFDKIQLLNQSCCPLCDWMPSVHLGGPVDYPVFPQTIPFCVISDV